MCALILWYNYNSMARSITIRILAALVVLGVLASPLSAGAWYCEGRQCGATPWECCCQSEESPHSNCTLSVVSAQQKASSCQSGCGCEVIVSADTLPAVAQTRALMGIPPAIVG